MPDNFLTLLDIANRNGSDQVVGLIEEGILHVPELSVLSGRTIRGTSYKALIRTSRPSAGFRSANEGVAIVASKYAAKVVECFILDAQMQVDKAIADAHEFGRDSLLTDEAVGEFQGAMEAWAAQFYYGTTKSSDKGFQGLHAFIDTAKMGVDATGSAANATTSVYLVWNDVRGIYPIFGSEGEIQMNDTWQMQQVQDAKGKSFMAYVNGTTGWVGLQLHKEAASRIYNLDDAKTLTDGLIAEAINKHPTGKLPSRIFMNRRAALQLQKSRSTTVNATGAKTAQGIEVFAPPPVESNNIPISVTEAITDTEAVV